MTDDTEREALAKLIYGAIAFHGGDPEHYEAMRDGIYHNAAAAILAKFLPAHDKRVRAEQREIEGLYRLQAAARLLSDLDRNEHGRHQGDIDSFDPTGISQGNPHLVTGQTIGYDIGGTPYVVPEPRERGVVKTWTAAIREASDD